LQNRHRVFQGSIVVGLGFVLDPNEARTLIDQDDRNRECLFPYLSGEDLNTSPTQSPARWVIQFDERSEAEARMYPLLWRIVEERVLPERKSNKRARYASQWWKHGENRQELYRVARL